MRVDVTNSGGNQFFDIDESQDMLVPNSGRLGQRGEALQQSVAIWQRAKRQLAEHVGMHKRLQSITNLGKPVLATFQVVDPDTRIDDNQIGGSSPSLGAQASGSDPPIAMIARAASR